MNRAQKSVLWSCNSDNWPTPYDFWKKLDDEFHFTLDPAADAKNAKAPNFFTVRQNGLVQDWSGHVVFVNPPYSRVDTPRWFKKVVEEYRKGTTVVVLAHARTDTQWFRKWGCEADEIRFVTGRLKFGDSHNSAPFPSAVYVYRWPRQNPPGQPRMVMIDR